MQSSATTERRRPWARAAQIQVVRLAQNQLLALAVEVGLRDACVLVALEGVEKGLRGFIRVWR
jgi:hypothetical protein